MTVIRSVSYPDIRQDLTVCESVGESLSFLQFLVPTTPTSITEVYE